MAFADMDDSDGDSSDGSDEELSGTAAAPVGSSRTSAQAQVPAALHRPPPPVAPRVAAPQPSPPPPAPPVRQPLASRVDLLNSSPAPRLAHQGSKAGLLFGKQGVESATGVLPPSHGTVAPGMYTYFDTHRGELVTARLLRADSGPGVLVEPPPMLVRVPPAEEAEAEDAMTLNGTPATADEGDADALLPPPPPPMASSKAALHRARRASAPPAPPPRRGSFPARLLLRSVVVTAAGVGLTLLGVKHRDTGVRAAAAAASHAQRAWQAAAASGQAVVATAMACVPTREGHPSRMTEWQRTTAAPAKARDGRSPREVRWQPHVSFGRG